MWHTSSATLALAILQFDTSLDRSGGTHNLDAYLEVVEYVEYIVTELQLPVACLVGALTIMSSLLTQDGAREAWGWHIALTVSISIACKLFFDEAFFVADLRPMSDLYSLDTLKAAERTAFDRVLAMGGLSDIVGRLELFRAAMLRTLLHQPDLHSHIFFDPADATTPTIRALVLEVDPLVATAQREMLVMLAPDADVTVCHTQEEALEHFATANIKPNLLLVDLCLNEKHTGHLSFLQIVSRSTGGTAFVDAAKDIGIEDGAPALSDGRALVIGMSSQVLNRAQELSLLHRGVHGVVQKPLTTATLRCAVGMVWE
jgi:hypothetical protein